MADIEISTVPIETTVNLTADYFWMDDVSDITGGLNRVTGESVRTALFATGSIDGGGLTSFEIPNSASPTVGADGEIALDTTVTDFSHGVLKYFGGEEMAVIAVPIAEFTSPSNGDVVKYNASTDEFELGGVSGTFAQFTEASGAGAASLNFHEDTDNGTNKVVVAGPSSVSSDKVQTLQDITGTIYVSGGTDVAVADGGTGGSNASTARTNLGVAYGKQTIYIPASGMLPATTAGAVPAQLETATNKVNYSVLDFNGSTVTYAHFNIGTPKSWNAGTLTYKVFWESSAADTDGVAWVLEAVVIADGDDPDTTWGTAITLVDNAASTPSVRYTSAESSNLTVGGSPASGEIVEFRFSRNTAHGSDTMSEDARLVGIQVFYTVDAGNDD